MANFSHTHFAANASFSICVYRDSIQVIKGEAYVTECHWPWTFCSRTAPKPWEEASAEMVVSAVGSYSVSMLGVVSSFLRLVKALSCVGSRARLSLHSTALSMVWITQLCLERICQAGLPSQGICRVLKMISVFPSVV